MSNFDYLSRLENDLVSQFRHQSNTKVLMTAIAKQLQEFYEVQEELIAMRWLKNATGKQLDGIGDIVVLTRAEATRLERSKSNSNEVNDDLYRKYLYYKLFLNTSTGTRKEIMKALSFFWNEAPLYYSEKPEFPATIFVETPELSANVPIEGLLEAPIIKPAGVRFIVQVNTKTTNDECKLYLALSPAVKGTLTHIPIIEQNAPTGQFKTSYRGLSVVKITSIQIPEIEQTVKESNIKVVGVQECMFTETNIGEIAN